MTDPIDDAIQTKRDEILNRNTLDEGELVLGTREAIDGSEHVPDRSCMNCAHRNVCAILNRFGAVLGEAVNPDDPDELPIDPVDLAKICDEFESEGEEC